MGFIRGNETLTVTNTYLFGTLRYAITSGAHLGLIMPATIKRNYMNKKGTRFTYFPILAGAALLLSISAILDVVLLALSFVEYIVALLVSPFGALLYPLTQREDSINTALHALEWVVPVFEIQKLDTYIELPGEPCAKNGECGTVITLGGYREVDWACDNCIAFIRKLKELNAGPGILDKINVRGHVVSEYCPVAWKAPRLIEIGGLKNLMKKDFQVFRTYDTKLFKWKRVFVRFRNPENQYQLQYELYRHRTERLKYAMENQEEFVALKSFSVSAKDWNKLHKSGFNNQNRQFIKLAGSAMLLGIQAIVGLLQIERNNNVTFKALAILVSTQLAWFQVISEVLLADVPREIITKDYFDRVSSARARAIRYVDNGDEQCVFSRQSLSWYVANTLTGSGVAKPVLPIELLLNANRLVTKEHVYNFSLTGITVWRHKILYDEEDAEADVKVEASAEYWPCRGIQNFEKGHNLIC